MSSVVPSPFAPYLLLTSAIPKFAGKTLCGDWNAVDCEADKGGAVVGTVVSVGVAGGVEIGLCEGQIVVFELQEPSGVLVGGSVVLCV